MSKNVLKLLAILSIVFVSCSEENEQNISIPEAQKNPLTAQEVKNKIDESIQSTGNFSWVNASAHLIWSASVHGQNIITIGFGNNKNDFDRSKMTNSSSVQNQILAIIEKYEGKEKKDFLIVADEFLTQVDVVIEKQETIVALQKNKYIRYIEPSDFKYFSVGQSTERSDSASTSSGCGYDATTLAVSDYTTITPNAKLPWNFPLHNINNAWNYATGQGITIGIVDTGVSPNQTLLGTSFNDGLSSGRSIKKYGVYVDSIWPWSTTTDGVNDLCGHGTSMASVAAAPRNDNGLPVGVAYNANLVTYRAASNVVLDGYHEQNGVKNAFTALGNNTAVKIISMSMGHIFSVSKISDGIKYAYSKGKLIFCAGGTSTSFTTFVGVIFPASMAEAVAVTGVKEGSSMQACDVCHTGSKIDFTVIMQRASSGNTVPVDSYYDNQTDYVGGSSVATATTAGIAALVWSAHPTWTRDQVLTKMRQSGSLYPNKSNVYGYGNINAQLAVQ